DMTAISALRSATLLAAVAAIGLPSAFAVDPGLAPRNTEPIVPSYADPYSTLPGAVPGTFDPFAPAGVPGSIAPGQPYGDFTTPRIAPTLVQPTEPIAPAR